MSNTTSTESPEGFFDQTVDYYVTDGSGQVTRQGKCRKDMVGAQALSADETAHIGLAPSVETSSEVVVTHVVARQQAYPHIGDQLDAIWKILGDAPPEILGEVGRSMLAQIAEVKKDYPKEMVFIANQGTDGPAYVPHSFKDEFNPQ